MKRIDANTVELNDQECLFKELFDLQLDQGYNQSDALGNLTGSRVPFGLRSDTSTLDSLLTSDFVAWLTI
jgi:hypothetical protein